MPSKYYRPELRNVLLWRRLLGYLSIAQNRPNIDIVTEAVATYLEAQFDDLAHQNPATSILNKVEVEKELQKICAFLER